MIWTQWLLKTKIRLLPTVGFISYSLLKLLEPAPWCFWETQEDSQEDSEDQCLHLALFLSIQNNTVRAGGDLLCFWTTVLFCCRLCIMLLCLKNIRVQIGFCGRLGSMSLAGKSVATGKEEGHWMSRSTFGIAEDGFAFECLCKLGWIHNFWGQLFEGQTRIKNK